MNELAFLTVIVDRGKGTHVENIFKEKNISFALFAHGRGTASDDIRKYLGLAEPEKDILLSVLPYEKLKAAMKTLMAKMDLDIPGNGIAFAIPVASVGGAGTLRYLSGDDNIKIDNIKENRSKMNAEHSHELIIAITNRGYVDAVMDAARGVNARGGTAIHARGTEKKQEEKFFGVSIAEEKDMVFIVSDIATKNDIMKAIMANAGMKTEARSIVFSLPISDVMGLRSEFENFSEADD